MKKLVFISLSVLLGFIASMVVHAAFEFWYISRFSPEAPASGGLRCFLPWYLQAGIAAAGVAGGYFAGMKWWRRA